MMSCGRAPSALRIPISRVRSVTLTSMMFMITMPPTTSEMIATAAGHRAKRLRHRAEEPDQRVVDVQLKRVRRSRRVVPLRPHQHPHLVAPPSPAPAPPSPPSHRSSASSPSRSSSETPSAALPTQLSWLCAKGAALLLADADHRVRRAVDAQLLPQRIDSLQTDGRECPSR